MNDKEKLDEIESILDMILLDEKPLTREEGRKRYDALLKIRGVVIWG